MREPVNMRDIGDGSRKANNAFHLSHCLFELSIFLRESLMASCFFHARASNKGWSLGLACWLHFLSSSFTFGLLAEFIHDCDRGQFAEGGLASFGGKS